MQEQQYIDLLKDILENGSNKEDRTDTGTLSVFGRQLRFDISGTKCPIITTKKMPWKSCIEELLWFLNGCTDSKKLEERGVKIWTKNTTRSFLDKRGLTHYDEGDIGPGYGFQWRHFGAKYEGCNEDYENKGIDQLENIIHLLKNDPFSRRIILTAWNPVELRNMALPPCHCFAQFYVNSEKELSCHMYQRSVDTFLGFPWNIASYSILTKILALKCDLKPKELIISTGDTHIYSNHIDQVKEQIGRVILDDFPDLIIDSSVKNKEFKEISINNFEVINYTHYGTIRADMAV